MNKKLVGILIAGLFIGTSFLASVESIKVETSDIEIVILNENSRIIPDFMYNYAENSDKYYLDRTYVLDIPFPGSSTDDNDDAGYKRDAGNQMTRAFPIYPGEIIDNYPGRGRTGKIDSGDEDWYFFSACNDQEIQVSVTPPSGFNIQIKLFDPDGKAKASSSNSISFAADMSGFWFIQFIYVSGIGEGQYSFDVTLNNQNDAGTGKDAGDGFENANLITPGDYDGYLDMNDEFDWYKFDVNTGEYIHLILKMQKLAVYSDFDLCLYNPEGELVHKEAYYYDDEFYWKADVPGEWRVKINIYPGYTDIPEPTNCDYFSYGSGAYNLHLGLEQSDDIPQGPIEQPDITPISQIYKISNDGNSNNDEYAYLASIPACNYLDEGKRYVSPIVYTGDSTKTNWFGTVDDTTNYLIDDWNNYLSLEDKDADIYNVESDPVQAAAAIAKHAWKESNLAVVAVDGSNYHDTTDTVLEKTTTLKRTVEVDEVLSSSPEAASEFGYLMFVGNNWGAITVDVYGIERTSSTDSGAMLTQVFPKFMDMSFNDWPVPYDDFGDATGLYYPVTTMGFWSAGSQMPLTQWSSMTVKKIGGDRYSFNVNDADAVLNFKVDTDTPSDLLLFLIDPMGHLRAPDIPTWTGEINLIHEWHGLENPEYNPWRSWEPEDHTEFSAQVLHPETGRWTALVVPRYPEGDSEISYTITGEITKVNPKRADAAISASNAAVIASLEHVPLLYVEEDSIPSDTAAAFSDLGINNVILVEKNNLGANVRSKLPSIKDDLKTMQEIIDYIKDYSASENYITITSVKSGDGYFAPSAMLAAYHGSPVLRIDDAVVKGKTSNNRIIISEIEDSAYCFDTSNSKYLWTYPSNLNLGDKHSEGISDDLIYLGTTNDKLYCLDKFDGSLLWSYPTNCVNENYEELYGDIYIDSDNCIIYCYDDNDEEQWTIDISNSPSNSPAGMAERIGAWRRWAGTYYHGIRAPGHLPDYDEPLPSTISMLIDGIKYILSDGVNGELPPIGLDAKKTWYTAVHDGIYNMIQDYGLDKNGQEAYVFVAPRMDIRLETHFVMMGNNSYAGHIPGETPAYTSAIINRNILYPALIHANTNKDTTTSQLMNFPDGSDWSMNYEDPETGEKREGAFTSRVVKGTFSSHGRTYEGHCIWDALLERLNNGASIFYYSGHGTGGSGISAQYIQTEHSDYPEQIWPDAWRGYTYDSWKTPRDNGMRWYNPEPPNLYDIIHFKWVDQLFENLKSAVVFYTSCSTGQSFGPMVFLDHGAVLWYGSAGSTPVPGPDLLDCKFFYDALVEGQRVGQAWASKLSLFFRDYTTGDPVSMYGGSSLDADTVHCIYGDPNLVVYSPDWEMPKPVEPNKENTQKPETRILTLYNILQKFLQHFPMFEKILNQILV